MGNNQRKIVGLMAFAVVFSLIGYEVKQSKLNQNSNSTAASEFGGGAKIILGGTVATVLLSFLADAGEVGAQVGTGLAGLACTTAVLVQGAPVWNLITYVMQNGFSTPQSVPSIKAGGSPIPNANPSNTPPVKG